MRLATYVQHGRQSIGIVTGDAVAPLTDFKSMLELIEGTAHADVRDVASVVSSGAPSVALGDVRLLAPLPNPAKIVAIGLNYVDHAAESGLDVPAEPVVFAKFPSAIIGPGAPITWDPALTDAVDFEAELAVVIGRTARNVDRDVALRHVFGYTCLNDVSARDVQFSDGQWVRGKSLDTFCPMGPVIVTADEVPEPQRLAIGSRIGDEVLQQATTGDMIFDIPELIARLSRSFTLNPGDVIATGTPPGVGYFREPRRLLGAGDTITVWVEGIGELTNPCVPGGA